MAGFPARPEKKQRPTRSRPSQPHSRLLYAPAVPAIGFPRSVVFISPCIVDVSLAEHTAVVTFENTTAEIDTLTGATGDA